MNNKTFWQKSAVAAFFAGWLFQLIGVFTHSLVPLIFTFTLWGYSLWCVAYKPVKQ